MNNIAEYKGETIEKEFKVDSIVECQVILPSTIQSTVVCECATPVCFDRRVRSIVGDGLR